jgi:alkanesulfonate monooxygenase SsuD/methylene tetrahydromethanopterin reductase-like flavin-dependent oxidoreductase (luciferase family)
VPFRNPALTAKMADTVEEISGGRLILGLGAGWHEPEFTAFGYPFDHLVDRFEEAVQIIRPLAKTGAVDFSGTYYQAPDCVSRPRGPRPEGPPILIASFRPRMLRLTAQYADAWNTAWLGWPTKLAERRVGLEAACAEVGRDPKTIEVTVGVSVAFPELGEAIEGADDRDKYLSGDTAEIAAGFRAYADEGVGHIICATSPNTLPALDRLTEALRVYRGG